MSDGVETLEGARDFMEGAGAVGRPVKDPCRGGGRRVAVDLRGGRGGDVYVAYCFGLAGEEGVDDVDDSDGAGAGADLGCTGGPDCTRKGLDVGWSVAAAGFPLSCGNDCVWERGDERVNGLALGTGGAVRGGSAGVSGVGRGGGGGAIDLVEGGRLRDGVPGTAVGSGLAGAMCWMSTCVLESVAPYLGRRRATRRGRYRIARGRQA